MELLDAALALALTLAALATIVTITMEIVLRTLGLHQRHQVELVKRLYDDVIAKHTGQTTTDLATRWAVVKKVLENPLAGKQMAPTDTAQGYLGGRSAPIYGKISLEHLLRRIIDVEEIGETYRTNRDELKMNLSALSLKYDEYRSAISTRFKSRTQLWSFIFGVILAIVMNVDGVRLFQGYLRHPEQAARVASQAEAILDRVEVTQREFVEAHRVGGNQGTIEDLNEAIDRLGSQLRSAGQFDLPIGRRYAPHCFLFLEEPSEAASSDPACADAYDPVDSLTWLIKVLLTGLLIGLGAPFWYDVARRLAEVRQAFGGRGTSEQRHQGRDGSESAEARESLIDRIVKDVMGSFETRPQAAPQDEV